MVCATTSRRSSHGGETSALGVKRWRPVRRAKVLVTGGCQCHRLSALGGDVDFPAKRGRASGRLPRAMASRPFPPPGSLQFKLVKTFVDLNVRVYRLTGGRLGGKVKGAPVLLLDHLGRKTGRARTTPVLYLRDGADLVIVGSRGGSDAMPAWFLNLMSSPSTTVQVGSERRAVVARQATPEEKQRLWPRLVEMYDEYAVYQQRTKREIPVVILSPAS